MNGEVRYSLFADYCLVWLFYVGIIELQVVAAQAIFLFEFKRRRRFALRLVLTVIIGLALSFTLTLFFKWLGYTFLAYVIVYTLLLFITVFAAWACLGESFVKILLCCTGGYCLQNFASRFTDLCFLLWTGDGLNFAALRQGVGLIITAVIYVLMNYLIVRRIRKNIILQKQSKPMIIFVIAGWIVTIFVSSAADLYMQTAVQKAIFAVLAIFCTLAVLLIQTDVLDKSKMREEMAVIAAIREKERQQLEYSRENVSLINRKCHDLKYQLRNLQGGKSIDKDELREIERAIDIYDSSVSTDNDVIDTVIRERLVYCEQHKVKLSCMFDGSKLKFLSVSDLYSLFGNALENAIEAVLKLPEDERLISITEQRMGEKTFVLQFVNPYVDEITLRNGLPQTTKKDDGYHGFGVDSMKAITEKYGGELYVNATGGMFTLSIILPLKSQEQ